MINLADIDTATLIAELASRFPTIESAYQSHNLDSLLAKVAEIHSIHPSIIKGETRPANVVAARFQFAAIARASIPGITLQDIGTHLDNRDSSSISYALTAHRDILASDHDYQRTWEKVCNAISTEN